MDSKEIKALTDRLVSHLAAMGDTRVWRPVLSPDGTVLAKGSGPSPEALADYASGVDFSGKTVVDLGCNLGLYSFMAARGGAVHVLGLDSDQDAVEGGRMLAALHGLDNVSFETRDFLRETSPEQADMVLVIDFIGRGVIAKGRLDAVLASAARHARREIVVTLRPEYPLEELPVLGAGLLERYGDHIEGGTFKLARYAQDRLGPQWECRTLHQGRVDAYALKAALLFTCPRDGSRSFPVDDWANFYG
jgi:SAM-dependent methyltransferase